jgi:hypothetical protein
VPVINGHFVYVVSTQFVNISFLILVGLQRWDKELKRTPYDFNKPRQIDRYCDLLMAYPIAVTQKDDRTQKFRDGVRMYLKEHFLEEARWAIVTGWVLPFNLWVTHQSAKNTTPWRS